MKRIFFSLAFILGIAAAVSGAHSATHPMAAIHIDNAQSSAIHIDSAQSSAIHID